MRIRQTPRNVPDKPNYLDLDIEGLGSTNWRIPSMIKAGRILSLLQKSGVMDAAASASNGAEIIENLGDKVPALLSCQGALLGMCWFNIKQDLETSTPKFAIAETSSEVSKKLANYGEEVFEELHEAGWEMGQVTQIFVSLTEKVVNSFVTQKEVAEKVDFLSQPQELLS